MIGIVGNGFVGNAVYQNFRDKTPCKVYDTDKNRSLNTLSEVIEQDFIFVCLPTPMRYGGECDLSILDNFFDGLPDNITGTFVIKSTVPIGTTKKYYERHNVIHNPEFLKIIRYVIKDANIFIISHKSGLEDKFEDHIRFEKHKGFSRIIS